MSPEAQQQHAEVSGPSMSDDLSLGTSTSPIEGESTTPTLTTTIEVLLIEDVAPISIRRVPNPSNASSDSDEKENISTRTNPRVITHSLFQMEPSSVQEGLPYAIQGEPHSDFNPKVQVEDNPTGCSQVEGELPSPIVESSDVVDIPSTAVADHQLPRLHVWTKEHPPAQIIRNPSASVETRPSHDLTDRYHYAVFISTVDPRSIKEVLD